MTPAISGTVRLVLWDKLEPRVRRVLAGTTFQRRGEVLLYEVPAGAFTYIEEQIVVALGSEVQHDHLLDGYHLVLPPRSDERQSGLESFFDAIAPIYEELIDVARNQENIRQLLNILARSIGGLRGKRLLDCGCGTGLAAPVADEFGCQLYGIDASTAMGKLAAGRGIRVLSAKHLESIEPFDGAFASYVLHLRPHVALMETVWRKLKNGGAFVANFHKSRGIEEINEQLRRLGARVEQVGSLGLERHGNYVLYTGKGTTSE